tara:strand:- start:180 stop:584 length:405 start_codon:yes stop_codon:yes gene_type:complete
MPAAAARALVAIKIVRKVIAVVGCDHLSHTGNSTGMTALSLPGLSTLLPAASAFTEVGNLFVARNAGTGTCIATLGVSPTTSLSAGKLVTSFTMTSLTSFITSVADVSPPKCHRTTASSASSLDVGVTVGGAGA